MAAVALGTVYTNKPTYGDSTKNTQLYVKLTQDSQSTSGNSSVVSWELYGNDTEGWEVGPIRLTINGTVVFNFTKNGDGSFGDHSEGRYQFTKETLIDSDTITITHGSDGTKSFEVLLEAVGIYHYGIDNPNMTGSETFELTPIVVSHTVYFDEQGGSVVADMSVTNGAAYGTLPTTTRAGYTFAGWYTEASGGTQVYATTASKSSDETLYAQWTANEYSLTYDANGGRLVDYPEVTTFKVEDIVYNYTTVYIESPGDLFLRNGATPTGWNTKADGTGTSWNIYIGTDYKWLTADNVTLYAQWNVRSTFKVTFDLKGGTSDEGNGPIVRTVNSGASATPPENVTKSGKTFMGWDGDYTNVTEDCTIHAVWGTTPVWILVEEGGKKVWKSYLDI